jgi:5-methylcytosine-specific restriction enzyme subunit McrC
MLTYAFKELRQNNYEYIAGEEFEDIHNLFAEILGKGIAYILKQGLHKEYISNKESLPTLRGKLVLQDTIREKLAQRNRLGCEYDELSEDNLFNQILKAAAMLLIRRHDVTLDRKRTLRQLMLFFSNVKEIPATTIHWDRIRYDRNTRSYQMLHSLCYFLLQSKLLSTDTGDRKVAQFSDDHMNMLFQRFVLAYYQRKHKECKAYARQIKWDLDEDAAYNDMLPTMQSDIFLTVGDRELIIDTKYYGKTTQMNHGKVTFHSHNVYQIYTYMMNEDNEHTGKVDGMLLYARPENDLQPNEAPIQLKTGNRIMVRTLNLNQEFKEITKQLDDIIYDL